MDCEGLEIKNCGIKGCGSQRFRIHGLEGRVEDQGLWV